MTDTLKTLFFLSLYPFLTSTFLSFLLGRQLGFLLIKQLMEGNSLVDKYIWPLLQEELGKGPFLKQQILELIFLKECILL